MLEHLVATEAWGGWTAQASLWREKAQTEPRAHTGPGPSNGKVPAVRGGAAGELSGQKERPRGQARK